MSMSSDLDGSDEIIPEDWPTYYTAVPVWVLLSGVSGQAYKAYGFLAEHINSRTPGRRISCPKQVAIARILGLKNPRQVAKYTAELEAVGAVRVEEYRYAGGMRRGYRYHVRFNPPKGYAGPTSLHDFYAANEDVRAASNAGRTAAATGKTAGRAGGTKNSTSGGAKNSTAHGAIRSTAHGALNGTAELNQSPQTNSSLSPVGGQAEGACGRASTKEREKAATPKDKPTTALPSQRAGGVDKLERVPTDVPGAFQPFQAPVPTDAPHTPHPMLQAAAQQPAGSRQAAEELVRAAKVVQPGEEAAFVAWATKQLQPRGLGWWRTLASNGDLAGHAADWQATRQPTAAAPAAEQPAWWECADCGKPAKGTPPASGVCRDCRDAAELAAMPQHCGDLDCDEITRLRDVEDANGFRVNARCPECHPSAVQLA